MDPVGGPCGGDSGGAVAGGETGAAAAACGGEGGFHRISPQLSGEESLFQLW